MSHPPFSSSVLDAGTVQTGIVDGVGTVRFAHPKSNSLPGVLLSRMAEAIGLMGQDPAVRVIVLRSEGSGAFCAGASFDEFKAVKDAEGGKQFFSGFAKVILAMIRSPKFVVTRVHGKTAGGGVGLVAASDYAIGVEGASLKLSELAIGIGPFVVGPVIEKKIGLAAFTAMAIDADWRSAAWAAQHGLYAEVVETVPALDHRVEEFAKKLAGYDREATRRLKESLWHGTEDWPVLLASRAEISGTLVLSEFTQRAVQKG
ncbi:MAG TPA: enoyl-CoA hydratase/isomerase family protein [Gemmatimonadales bacterium]